MDPFFDKWLQAEAVHHPSVRRNDKFAAVTPDDPQRIEANLEKVYEGTRPAVLKRLDETNDRSDEMTGLR